MEALQQLLHDSQHSNSTALLEVILHLESRMLALSTMSECCLQESEHHSRERERKREDWAEALKRSC